MLNFILRKYMNKNNEVAITSQGIESKTTVLTKEEKKAIRDTKKQERQQMIFENKEISKFTENWVKTMAYIGIKNKFDETYALRNIKYEPYGFSCNIHTPFGLSLDELDSDKNISIIQQNLECLFMIKVVPKTNYAEAKFITKDIPLVDFKPIPLHPYETYLSTGIDGKPIVSNMIKYPHILIQGATNMGKTKFIDTILTNLISTTPSEDLSLYIIQADKNDQIVYKKTKHCQGYVEDLKDTYCMLRYILSIIEARNNKLKPLIENGLAGNIYEYNTGIEKGYIKNAKKWSYMYLVIDEYSSLMPDGEYDKERKAIKQMIQTMMERILQISRATGLFCILSTQRATIDKMPSFIKAMCCTLVSFKVNNQKSSEVALDCGDAVKLKQREFIVKIEDNTFGRTPNLTPKKILDYIKPFKVNSANDISFNSFNNLDTILDNKKKKKSSGRMTKAERKAVKEKALETVKKDTAITKAEKLIEKENNIINKTVKEYNSQRPEKTPSNFEKITSKQKNPYLLDNWVDPLTNPNVKIIDKTGLPPISKLNKEEDDINVKR